MSNAEKTFHEISEKFCKRKHVVLGKMMSSPGLKVRNKIFAFYHREEMGFRLGPLFDPKKQGIKSAKPLSPFKTKPPLKGWYIIPTKDLDLWSELSEMAFDFTCTLK